MTKNEIIETIIQAVQQMIDGAIRDTKPREEYDDYGGMDRYDGEKKLRDILNLLVKGD